MCLTSTVRVGMEWSLLVQYRVQWRVFVNTVMSFRVSKIREIFDKLYHYHLLKEDTSP
jgi:hypothetical protein